MLRGMQLMFGEGSWPTATKEGAHGLQNTIQNVPQRRGEGRMLWRGFVRMLTIFPANGLPLPNPISRYCGNPVRDRISCWALCSVASKTPFLSFFLSPSFVIHLHVAATRQSTLRPNFSRPCSFSLFASLLRRMRDNWGRNWSTRPEERERL